MIVQRENFSRKRKAILDVLYNTKQHPTAEWVFQRLRPEYPELSLGTVYRNLKRFCETGQAMSIGVIGGQEHFDGCTEPHAHLVCSHCGKVLDIFQGLPGEAELSKLSEQTGYRIEGVSITFSGLCPDCAGEEALTEQA